jgi:CheY-like chemotaxis protein
MHTILVVEDEPEVRDMVSAVLDDAGHKVVLATNGVEALARLEEVRPDAILSNVVMPVMDGKELCKEIQAHPEYRTIPVIFLSGTQESIIIEDCKPAALIMKPFDFDELLSVINAILRPPGAAADKEGVRV